MKKPTIKEKKFIKAKVQGKTHAEAYLAAGYAPNNKNVMTVAGSVIAKRPHVQQAIEAALEAQGLTPEWAVAQLGKVASQDEELGAKRLASKDILELHGWNKNERPNLELNIKNAFFQGGRRNNDAVIDVEAEE
jgi:phage terminase small subunit